MLSGCLKPAVRHRLLRVDERTFELTIAVTMRWGRWPARSGHQRL